MHKYIDYLLSQIVSDVNYLETIIKIYPWYSCLFVALFWIWWIVVKFGLMTLPIWGLFNLTIGNLKFFSKTKVTNITNVENDSRK